MRVEQWTGVESGTIDRSFLCLPLFYFILIKDPGSDPKKFYSVTKTTADQGLPVFGIIDTRGASLC